MKERRSVKAIFQQGTPFRFFLISVLIGGLAYGLYRGMLDNFLAEIVHMGEMGKGVTEFFRELPGIAWRHFTCCQQRVSTKSVR